MIMMKDSILGALWLLLWLLLVMPPTEAGKRPLIPQKRSAPLPPPKAAAKKKKCPHGHKNCAGGGGDPHFRMWDDTLYSFHGECDLVVMMSSEMDLTFHARTKIVDDYSLISNIALRIGNDTFEITNDGNHYFNGVKDVALPVRLAGRYDVTKGEDIISTFENDGSSHEVSQPVYTMQLKNDDTIRISIIQSMITINVDGEWNGMKGMLGTTGLDGFIGRDGITQYDNPISMGMEWQVNDKEPMLFHNISGPQYPDKCLMPSTESTSSTTRRRRLGQQSPSEHTMEFREMAKTKCAISAPADLQTLCVEDIVRIGDINIASAYAF